MRNRSLAAIVPMLAIAATAAGCGKTVVKVSDEKSLATRGATAASQGQPPKSVSCPSDVEMKLNKTFDCHVKLADGSPATLTIKIDRVNGNNGHMVIVAARQG